jgi:hypothetical protein
VPRALVALARLVAVAQAQVELELAQPQRTLV